MTGPSALRVARRFVAGRTIYRGMAIRLSPQAVRAWNRIKDSVATTNKVRQIEVHNPQYMLWDTPYEGQSLADVLTEALEDEAEALEEWGVEAGPPSGYRPYQGDSEEGTVVAGVLDPVSDHYVLLVEYEVEDLDASTFDDASATFNAEVVRAFTSRGVGRNWTYSRRMADEFARRPQSMQERRPTGANVVFVILQADDPGTGYTPPEATVFWDEAEVRFKPEDQIRVKQIRLLPSGPLDEEWLIYESFRAPAG